MKLVIYYLTILIGAMGMFIAAIAYGLVTTGLTIYLFNDWFLVSQFHTPPISFTQSIGIGCVLILFKNISPTPEYYFREEKIQKKENWATIFLIPWGILGIGYLVHIILY